ncbi:MAG: hydrogenase [Anaerolineae bacterium]|nr:hydrogenase [Anaerolineae bacterium]MCB0224452.1 hydrogenase [Anaerolineae bacterium]MCB9106043.1 hydrogenase [Anaerolineales bacterium]
MNFWLLLLPSLLAALLAFTIRPYRAFIGWTSAGLSLVSLGAALAFVAQALEGGPTPTWGFVLGPLHLPDVLRADSLSVLLMVCVAGVATPALFLSPGLWGHTRYTPTQLRRYQIFTNLFIAAMLLAVSANNVGIMWIAIEATTIFSAFVIPLKLNKASIEASWKYILISSVGIALAFVGTVLAYFDYVSRGGEMELALNWPVLKAAAPLLQPEVMQLAFVFLLIGYGTKVGIAPMHTWKPDAYGESPAPLGALMASPLFAVAMYAILRWKAVIDISLRSNFTNNLLFTLGLLSLIVAAFSVVQTTNYKRMLAYSSIEHTGLICFGFALGAPGLFAAMLHLINHTLAKSLMFFVVGDIEDHYNSALIKNVQGMAKLMPWSAGLFTVGLFTLIGLPPFAMFTSEYALFHAGFALHHPWLMGVALALLAIIFISFIKHLTQMLYGSPPQDTVNKTQKWGLAILGINIIILVILGITLPTPVRTLLDQIVAIVI